MEILDLSLFKAKAQAYGLRKAFEYAVANSEENLDKLLDMVLKLDFNGAMGKKSQVVYDILSKREGVWYDYIMKILKEVNPNQRAKFIDNVVINATLFGWNKSKSLSKKYDCNIPWAILMDPTSACNLRCTGCWAADYGNRLNLSVAEMSSVIEQGKELGVYAYIFSGGEPLVRKRDIITLCKKHPDCFFLAFTNGTLIDNEFADEMAEVGNFIPAISIEGFEADTDFRRGEGCYKSVVRAMEILKRRNLVFGISCCYTHKNVATIGSEEFIDDMIARGAYFAWYFTYIPIGKGAVKELMATAEDRRFMYHQVRKFREMKPIFTMDFWNDGEYVKGCVAAGRAYLHINANGDMEPCAFIHYSDSNIRNKKLLEGLQSPLFMSYRRRQPFNENHLRPCPLLDNPTNLVEIVEESGAESTDLEYKECVRDLCAKCKDAALRWSDVADELWEDR